MIRVTEFRLVLALLAVAACSGDATSPARQTTDTGGAESILLRPSLPNNDGTGATLIACPTPEAQSVTARIGPLGGLLAIGNTRVLIPLGAVLSPEDFTLTIPQSPYAEIRVRTGTAEHYLFQRPVLMTIDYSRCATPELDREPLSVWNIDPDSKALLEQMIGVDVKLTHTITFTTIHLSGYAVADRTGDGNGGM